MTVVLLDGLVRTGLNPIAPYQALTSGPWYRTRRSPQPPQKSAVLSLYKHDASCYQKPKLQPCALIFRHRLQREAVTAPYELTKSETHQGPLLQKLDI